MSSYFKKSKILIVIIGILVIVVLNLFQGEVRNFFYFLSQPIQEFLWQKGMGVSGLFEGILRAKSISKELEVIKSENRELLAQLEKLKSQKEENKFLREALEIGLKKDFELILANIIARDLFEDSILINAGAREGVLENQPVITQQKVLLGKVNEVYADFSRVLLTSHKEMSFSAKIQGDVVGSEGEGEEDVSGDPEKEEIKGVIKGRGCLKMSFELAPREAEIKKGDILVTDILGGLFPEVLLVGKIEDFEQLDVEVFQRAKATPLFELEKIDQVFIIKKW